MIYVQWWKPGGELFKVEFTLLFFLTTRWRPDSKPTRQDTRDRPGTSFDTCRGRSWEGIIQMFFYWPVMTERGQGEGITVQGILWKGTITWSTGCFVCVIIWRLQQPHRTGGWKYETPRCKTPRFRFWGPLYTYVVRSVVTYSWNNRV